MPSPQLFGAPNPPDTSGAIQGNMRASDSAAQMQAQSAMQAAQLVVGSLQSALELRQRRDAQARELEARKTMEQNRLAAENRWHSEDMAQKRRDANQKRISDRLDRRQRGEYQEATIGVQREGLGIQRAQAQNETERLRQQDERDRRQEKRDQERLAMDRDRSKLANELDMLKLQEGHDEFLHSKTIDFAKGLTSQALAFGLLQPGAVPGSSQVDLAKLGQFTGGVQGGMAAMGGALPGALGAPLRAMAPITHSPTLGSDLQGELEKGIATQNELAVKQGYIDAQGGKGGISFEPSGPFPITEDALKKLVPSGAADGAIIGEAMSAAANGRLIYDPEQGFRASDGGTIAQQLDEIVQRQQPGVLDEFFGAASHPELAPTQRRAVGRDIQSQRSQRRAQQPTGAPQKQVPTVPEGKPDMGGDQGGHGATGSWDAPSGDAATQADPYAEARARAAARVSGGAVVSQPAKGSGATGSWEAPEPEYSTSEPVPETADERRKREYSESVKANAERKAERGRQYQAGVSAKDRTERMSNELHRIKSGTPIVGADGIGAKTEAEQKAERNRRARIRLAELNSSRGNPEDAAEFERLAKKWGYL